MTKVKTIWWCARSGDGNTMTAGYVEERGIRAAKRAARRWAESEVFPYNNYSPSVNVDYYDVAPYDIDSFPEDNFGGFIRPEPCRQETLWP